MKRIYSALLGIFSVALLIVYIGVSEVKAYEEDEETSKGEFYLTYEGVIIRPWEKDGEMYFFLPSYFEWENAGMTVVNGELQIDGETVASLDSAIYETEKEYAYEFAWGEERKSGSLRFLQSANIGTVYIETESGSMEEIHKDKAYREGGWILVKDAQGNEAYGGLLESVKGRGNATWEAEKKSYSIKLASEADLFQMGESKSWILLCNIYDGNKLQNKICTEMAQEIGLSYTPQSEWVDLYLNGEYWGNYLLCERIEIDESRVDITDLEEETKLLNGSMEELELFDTETQKGVLAKRNPENIEGGYILEKDYYYDGVSGFITEDGNPFSFSSPEYATQEQVAYMADYVQTIENMILSGDEEAFDYIDLDSLVLRYLVDEVVCNYDMGITSMYFYKEQGDPLLYAGPVWDYDRALGLWGPETKVLLTLEIQNYKNGEGSLTWYPYLYCNETFYEKMTDTYENVVRPYIVELIRKDGKIDRYAARIRESVRLDMVRWPYVDYDAGRYESFDSNVRYMKYFLARRLRFFDQEWLGEDNHYEPQGTGEEHTVTFVGSQGTEEVKVSDGEVIIGTPEYLLGEKEWWYTMWNSKPLYSEVPIFGDITYEAWTGIDGEQLDKRMSK